MPIKSYTDLLMIWAISLNVDDYLQMPECIDTVMRVNMPPSRLAEYKQLERDFIMQINEKIF